MQNYEKKYIKYKLKYLDLKHTSEQIKQLGGQKNLIIHICGPSGAGKTTLGNKLKISFGEDIIVKDFDNLHREFVEKEYGGRIKMIDKKKYQAWIDKFISEQTKTIILTGLNHMPWWHKNHYYTTHAQHKYYINLDSNIIFKQKCKRFITDVFCDNQESLLKELEENNKEYIKDINRAINGECNLDETIKMNNMWNRDYKKQGYIFSSREHIFEEVSKIIKKELAKKD